MANAPKPLSPYASAIIWPLRWAYWIVIFFSLSLTFSIVVAFVAVHWFAGQTLQAIYLQLLSDAMGTSLTWYTDIAALMHQAGQILYEWVFVKTGFEAAFIRASMQAHSDSLDRAVFGWLGQQQGAMQTAEYATRLYAAKLVFLVAALPFFIFAYAVALVDGLTLRHIRTIGGGRESSLLYHRSKRTLIAVFGTALMLFLSLPVAINSVWILPALLLFEVLLVRLQWTYYKKYL